ncbi:type II secretion system F family protein [Geodermatophilus sp. FMUSA9-8]|uniref:type II secretion system F family protein n=1 Tax=Geodermatophilus sp. FMUSA9-8 TaxID=3120155 RepID=UPI00300849CA
MTPMLWVAVGAVALGLATGVLVLAVPRPPRVGLDRLAPGARPQQATRLGGAADDTAALADRVLRRLGRAEQLELALERAGISRPPAEVALVVTGATAGAALAGGVLGGVVLGVLLAVLPPVAAVVWVNGRRDRRQAAFADQLDDALHLMASSLRAGHSVLRALDAVSRDAPEPTSIEFSRVVNETRVGRDVNRALEEVAERTASRDFAWVVQAIAIHREVGGNLAEVLDRVSTTIRERNALRRHARSLSAEGRMSGLVLMLMPVGVFCFLSLISPTYFDQITGTSAGVVMLVVAAVLMLLGGLWLRAVVKVRF